MPGYSCTICFKKVVADDLSVSCSKCSKFFHATCANLAREEIEFFKAGNDVWNCTYCVSTARSLRSNSSGAKPLPSTKSGTMSQEGLCQGNQITLKHFELLMEHIRGITATMERIERRQDDLISQVACCSAKIQEHSEILAEHELGIATCKSNISALERDQSSMSVEIASVAERVADLQGVKVSEHGVDMSEVLDRVEKSHNIILTNVPESTDLCSDSSLVKAVVDHVRPSSSNFITGITRLPGKDNIRPRWVKVSFSTSVVTRSLLRNKSLLLGHREYRSIRIFDDKTRKQADELKMAREELARRQASGETDLTIKYVSGRPKVVNTVPAKNVSKNIKP